MSCSLKDLIRGSDRVELEHTRSFSDEFAYFWPQIPDDQIIRRINGAAIRLCLQRLQTDFSFGTTKVSSGYGAATKIVIDQSP